jgi:hypothetical protein
LEIFWGKWHVIVKLNEHDIGIWYNEIEKIIEEKPWVKTQWRADW